jgi:hypothetical protein
LPVILPAQVKVQYFDNGLADTERLFAVSRRIGIPARQIDDTVFLAGSEAYELKRNGAPAANRSAPILLARGIGAFFGLLHDLERQRSCLVPRCTGLARFAFNAVKWMRPHSNEEQCGLYKPSAPGLSKGIPRRTTGFDKLSPNGGDANGVMRAGDANG